jgi:hypothetical protein
MDLSRVIDMRVDPSLEDVFEMLRVCMLAFQQAGKVDVKECRTTTSVIARRQWQHGGNPHVAEVEEALVAQVNRLLMQHLLGNHAKSDTLS